MGRAAVLLWGRVGHCAVSSRETCDGVSPRMPVGPGWRRPGLAVCRVELTQAVRQRAPVRAAEMYGDDGRDPEKQSSLSFPLM
jgi:hypothetical protein